MNHYHTKVMCMHFSIWCVIFFTEMSQWKKKQENVSTVTIHIHLYRFPFNVIDEIIIQQHGDEHVPYGWFVKLYTFDNTHKIYSGNVMRNCVSHLMTKRYLFPKVEYTNCGKWNDVTLHCGYHVIHIQRNALFLMSYAFHRSFLPVVHRSVHTNTPSCN